MKKRYIFNGPKSEETHVIAEDERTARDLAMKSRWGEPDDEVVMTRYEKKDGKEVKADIQYSGWGLTLIRVEEVRRENVKHKRSR
jgi:hypothetical protein